MEHPLRGLINLNPSQELSLKEVLESFNHIELTEDEMNIAMIEAKRKKEILLNQQEIQRRAEENRKFLTGMMWTRKQTEQFMKYRAAKIFNGRFEFEGQVSLYFQLLCAYFSMDFEFFVLAKQLDVDNPSFNKGIYLGGNFGVGKTWLMKLFQRNQRQVYTVQNAKEISNLFESDGGKAIEQFSSSPMLPINDAENFYHKKMGLCIDDLGTEQIKNHFGNKKNVIGDLIELRYANENAGPFLHVTTNLTGSQLNDFYGPRIASRFRETMNIVDFVGDDRRK